MRTLFFVPVLASVIAFGIACSSESTDAASGAPFAPTRLTVAQMGTGIHVTWKDNSADEEEFEIERKAEGGAFARIASVTFDVVQHHDTGVSAGKAYVYRVRAVNGAKKSPYSNEASMQAPATATGGTDAGTVDAGTGSSVGWDGGTVSFTKHVIPLFEKSCGTAKTGCHVREAYGASSAQACRGWLTLENASLGSKFYSGSNMGDPTGCPDRSLYQRLVELDAWQEPNGQIKKYVKPNDPANSYLFNKIAGGPYGEDRPGVASSPMPMSSSLSAEDIAMVKKWIESGAPSN